MKNKSVCYAVVFCLGLTVSLFSAGCGGGGSETNSSPLGSWRLSELTIGGVDQAGATGSLNMREDGTCFFFVADLVIISGAWSPDGSDSNIRAGGESYPYTVDGNTLTVTMNTTPRGPVIASFSRE